MEKNILKVIIAIFSGALLGGLYGYYGKCQGSLCILSSNPLYSAIFGALAGIYVFFVFRNTSKKD